MNNKIIIRGHVSPETAFIVYGYPFGSHLKCLHRYWLETATKGAKVGQTRINSQTTHKDFNRIYTAAIADNSFVPGADLEKVKWNAAKGGNYYPFGLMYTMPLSDTDERRGVHMAAASWHDGPERFAEFRADFWEQMDEAERTAFLKLENTSKRLSPRSWAEYRGNNPPMVGEVLEDLAAIGAIPTVVNAVG